MKHTTYEAIVLSIKPYKDADALVNLFTKESGKATFVAKGLKKLSSKKRGVLQPFSKVKCSVLDEKMFSIMTEAVTLDNFEHIRLDLKRIAVAYFFCEVIDKMTQTFEANEALYTFLADSLEELSHDLRQAREAFCYKVSVQLGFWPEGQEMLNPDAFIESITEKKLSSIRVGKAISRQK